VLVLFGGKIVPHEGHWLSGIGSTQLVTLCGRSIIDDFIGGGKGLEGEEKGAPSITKEKRHLQGKELDLSWRTRSLSGELPEQGEKDWRLLWG